MGTSIDTLRVSILASLAALVALSFLLRRGRWSLGLPLAYLGLLLLQHVPGAIAHAFAAEEVSFGIITPTAYTDTGMFLTVIGAVSFVIGVALAGWRRMPTASIHRLSPEFPKFCLYGGWLVTFAILPIANLPSIGAAVDKAGALWILGALIGLRGAIAVRRFGQVVYWLAATMVYPVIVLLMAGFLSYGTAAVMIAVSALAVTAKSMKRVCVSIALIALLGTSVFANYFVARDKIRAVVWSDADWWARISVTINAFSDFEPLALSNPKHVVALDQRLNQNFFVGKADSLFRPNGGIGRFQASHPHDGGHDKADAGISSCSNSGF